MKINKKRKKRKTKYILIFKATVANYYLLTFEISYIKIYNTNRIS